MKQMEFHKDNNENNTQNDIDDDMEDIHPNVEHYENLIIEKNKEIKGLIIKKIIN